MKFLNLTLFIMISVMTISPSYSLNSDFTQGYTNTFQSQNKNNFNQRFVNPNSYMNKNQYTGTSPSQHIINNNQFNRDALRYNSSCQFGVCVPGGN